MKGRICTAQIVLSYRCPASGIREAKVYDEYGNVIGDASLDQERDDLPLTITCLEIASGEIGQVKRWGEEQHIFHDGAQYILSEATEVDNKYRRLGPAMFFGTPRPENYLFFDIEKTVLALT